jgi:hypothetical protein
LNNDETKTVQRDQRWKVGKIAMNESKDPATRHRNALAAALVLGLVPAGYKGKKGKTKCQQKKKTRLRDSLPTPELGYTLRQCSRTKFLLTSPKGTEMFDLKRRVPRLLELENLREIA